MAQGKNAPMFDDVGRWFQSFLHPTVLIELGTLAGCTVLAWLVVSGLRRALHRGDSRSILFGRKVLDGVLFPLTLLGLVYLAQAVLLQWIAVAAFKVAIPVLMALVVIRVGVKVLQAAFPQSPWVRPIERTLSWLAWLAMVLWVTGLLPLVLQDLDDIIWKVGGTAMSVRTMIEGLVTAAAVLIATLWISSSIEARFLRSATGSELSVRKALSNATRALLLFVGAEHHLDPGPAAAHGASLAEAAQLDLCGGPAGAGALLVVGEEWLAGAPHLPVAGDGSAVAAAREAAASLAPAPAATPETERGLIGLFFGDLSAVGIDLQLHPRIVGIQGFHLEFVPFQLDFPNVVVPLCQQQLDQGRHVETRLSRPAKGGKKAEDQQDTAWDHIHSGFMAGTL